MYLHKYILNVTDMCRIIREDNEGKVVKMSKTIELKKWGNSLAVRLPKSLLTKIGVDELPTTFDVKINENKEIILRPKKESKLAQRFEGFNYKKYWADWEKENPGKSKEMDWGEPVGKEMKW